ALIVFAFIFDFWEIIFFVLLSVFIINWQPAPSLPLIIFGIFPIFTYGFRTLVPWQPWAGVLIATAAGLFLLYLSVSPTILLANLNSFFLDLFVSAVFASLIFSSLKYSPRH